MAVLLNPEHLFIPEFVETAKIHNTTGVQVISSEVDLDRQVAELGSELSADASIVVRASQAATEDQLVVFRTKTYRIVRISEDSAGATKRLYLAAKYGGR